MKIQIIISILITANFSFAQNTSSFEGVIFKSAETNSIKLPPQLLSGLAHKLTKQAEQNLTLKVSPDLISRRLNDYFRAKSKFGPSQFNDIDDFCDLNWQTLIEDNKFRSVKAFRWKENGSPIMGIVDADKNPHLTNTVCKTAQLVIPAGSSVAVFSKDNKILKQMYVDGVGETDVSDFNVENSKGVEIYVDSTPDKALVFFNKKKYHHTTKTSTVQDPGVIEVKITKAGYKDWVHKKSLSSGESWNVSAALEKK